MRIDYGEILFVGPCNFKCFYCLGHEMHESTKYNTLNTHFSEWINFESWLKILHDNNVTKLYLSATNSEPLLYQYVSELIDYLQDQGFNVGIRTNGSIDTEICNKCKEEISLSLQSLNPITFKQITGVDLTFDFLENLSKINSDNVRVSIVVNRYNFKEVLSMIESLSNYNLRYIQLRQCYKYYEFSNIEPDIEAFDYVLSQLNDYPISGNFNESVIYDVNGTSVSIWRTVFKKSSISSSNYWTNGVITQNNLLVEGYEDERSRLLH